MAESGNDQRYETKYLLLTDLVPNEWNPQTMKDPTFLRLREEMKTVGCISPLAVVPNQEGKYRIIGGEHRWKAAQLEGLKELPCMILDGKKWEDKDLQKFVTIRLNIIQGHLDPEKFIRLYNEMSDKYGVDAVQGLMGFTDAHGFQKLIGEVKKGMKKTLPKEMQEEFEKSAKEVKTVEELSRIIQEMFTKFGDSVPQNFMIFTHGKQEHLYIAMDKRMKKAMDKVIEYCRQTGEDINAFLAPVTEAYLKASEARLKKKKEEKNPFETEPAPVEAPPA